jgi:uncharacterized protein YkwD
MWRASFLFLSIGCSAPSEVMTHEPMPDGGDARSDSNEASTNPPDANSGGAPHMDTKTLPGATGSEPGGSIPTCCTPSTSEKADIDKVFELLNAHRAANGVAPLTYDPALEAAVEAHCHHSMIHTFFSHTAPEGAVSTPSIRAAACGGTSSGENLVLGPDKPEYAMMSWQMSPGHEANMLRAQFTRVGIGRWDLCWGQLFGQ